MNLIELVFFSRNRLKVAVLVAALGGTTGNALAGSSSGPGIVNYKDQTASVSVVAENWTAISSWFFSFLSKPDLVGPAADTYEIGSSIAGGAEKFAGALDEIDDALDFSLAVIVGVDQPVRSQNDLRNIQRAVRERTGQQHLDDFSLTRVNVDKIVEQKIAERGLKAW